MFKLDLLILMVLQSLFKNLVVLQRLLAENVSLFNVLFVYFLDSLLIVGFGDVPRETASKVSIPGVHAYENFFKVSYLILGSLIV